MALPSGIISGGVACVRLLRPMKAMAFPSGDQRAAAGNAPESSGGVRLRRNLPSAAYISIRNSPSCVSPVS